MTYGRGRRAPRLRRWLAAAAAAVVAVIATGSARAQAPAPAPVSGRRVDAYVEQQQISGGFGDWHGGGVRLVVPAGARDVWFVEALQRRAFKDAGAYVSVANQHVWSDHWYGSVSLGGGSGEFVLPDVRFDASLSRKWGQRGALVSSLGTTLVDAKRGYHDVGAFGSLAAYLSPVAVAEGGVRVSRSTPGRVDATRGFGALSLGSDGHSVVVLRYTGGGEGYQLLGFNDAVRRFTSHEGSVSLRQWIGHRGGLLLQGERYANPYYRRTGVTGGFFAHW